MTVLYRNVIPDLWPDVLDLGFCWDFFWGPCLEDCWGDVRWLFILLENSFGTFFGGFLNGLFRCIFQDRICLGRICSKQHTIELYIKSVRKVMKSCDFLSGAPAR